MQINTPPLFIEKSIPKDLRSAYDLYNYFKDLTKFSQFIPGNQTTFVMKQKMSVTIVLFTPVRMKPTPAVSLMQHALSGFHFISLSGTHRCLSSSCWRGLWYFLPYRAAALCSHLYSCWLCAVSLKAELRFTEIGILTDKPQWIKFIINLSCWRREQSCIFAF